VAYRLIWSPTARLDLRDIFDYIAQHHPLAAQKFVETIMGAVERLMVLPESGRIVPEFSEPTIREVIHRPCRIVYRVRKDQELVEIVRVWHGARGTPNV
jgi:toxin ParE1/3/4